jgi:tRNA A-37 threonylcarbamoyl transferase component Bud32
VTDAAQELLSAETALPYLRARGVIADGPAAARELGGGVSNVVLEVVAGDRGLVLKQALPRLRVAHDWRAKRERTLVEARALGLALALAPGTVPRVLDVDAERCAIAIELAPPALRPWKDVLLDGEVDPAIAAELGRLLALWHGDGGLGAAFDEWDSFEQLRIDPYYREVARVHPELADAVLGYADAMAERRIAFVHGDLSPKNVLVGDGALWVIDFEVAHRGDPVFDLAFLTTHLLLKGVARATCRPQLHACVEAFHAAYEAAGGARIEPRYLLGHVGCLLLARVDGKSPVEYLDEPEHGEVRTLARTLILTPPGSLGDLFALLDEDA